MTTTARIIIFTHIKDKHVLRKLTTRLQQPNVPLPEQEAPFSAARLSYSHNHQVKKNHNQHGNRTNLIF
jgi:hypothetical protein